MHISSLLHYLRQIRQPYLSTSTLPNPPRHRTGNESNNNPTSIEGLSVPTHLTDTQRAEIDTQTSSLLHDLSSRISSLTAAENLRHSTETALLERKFGKRGGNNILWRWAAGDQDDDDATAGKSDVQIEAEGRASGVRMFREGVLWYLGWRLRGTVEVQRGMVEIRAEREREKEKSALWKIQSVSSPNTRRAEGGAVGGGQIPRRTPGQQSDADTAELTGGYKLEGINHNGRSGLEDYPSGHIGNGEEPPTEPLPAHLLQLFETENSALLDHYSSSLSKIAQAEKSLLEISSLQSTLLAHLSTQGEMIEQLVMNAAGTDENVRSGNREMKRAGERWGRGLARGVFWCTVGICGFLVGWDLVF